MRSLAHVTFAIIILAATFSLASADETITVVADSTLSGNAGFILHIESTDDAGLSIFAFEEADKIRLYAFRDYGSQLWDISPSPQYLVRSQSLAIGNTWNFIENDLGGALEAEVVALVSVTVPAGTFNAYQVDLTLTAQPSEVLERMWFVDGIGFVKNEGYLSGGSLDWRDELSAYTIVGGTGFFPLAVGNSWTWVDAFVPVRARTWGELKAKF